MNLFEYQGKRLYQDFSIPTPKSIFVSSISEITDNHGLTYPVVVKAQVQVGGRGKACLLYTSPSPRDEKVSRMPSSA